MLTEPEALPLPPAWARRDALHAVHLLSAAGFITVHLEHVQGQELCSPAAAVMTCIVPRKRTSRLDFVDAALAVNREPPAGAAAAAAAAARFASDGEGAAAVTSLM